MISEYKFLTDEDFVKLGKHTVSLFDAAVQEMSSSDSDNELRILGEVFLKNTKIVIEKLKLKNAEYDK